MQPALPEKCADARTERFEFAGLLAGEYMLSVVDDEMSSEAQTFRFTIQVGQVRDDLVLRLSR